MPCLPEILDPELVRYARRLSLDHLLIQHQGIHHQVLNVSLVEALVHQHEQLVELGEPVSERGLQLGLCVLEECKESLRELEHGAVGLEVVSHVAELDLLEVDDQVLEHVAQHLLKHCLAQVGLVLRHHEELGLPCLEERRQELDVLASHREALLRGDQEG